MNVRRSPKAKFLLSLLLLIVFSVSLGTFPVLAATNTQPPGTGPTGTAGTDDPEDTSFCPKPSATGELKDAFNYIPIVCLFTGIKKTVQDLDIRRVVQDSVHEMIVGVPLHMVYGRSADQIHYCVAQGLGATVPQELMEANENEDCSDMMDDPLLAYAGVDVPRPTSSRMGGSLVGVASRMLEVTYNSAPPINLAYYAKYTARKIPILGNTAFAQGAPDSPTLTVTLKIWELSRNLAYGMMTIFMLVIGVMIMMRKQLDSRTSVTIQHALPRIVIATILITFSYAIGAFAITLIPALVAASLQPLLMAYQSSYGTFGTWFVVTATVWILLAGLGTGPISMILITLALITMLLLLCWVILMAFIAYFKIILQIIIGPVILAWGAIPGNEDATIEWFKHIAINMLVVPLMMFFIGVTILVGWELALQPFMEARAAAPIAVNGAVIFAKGTNDGAMASLQVPIFMMMILFFAGKLPKQLEESILGTAPKKKKK